MTDHLPPETLAAIRSWLANPAFRPANIPIVYADFLLAELDRLTAVATALSERSLKAPRAGARQGVIKD
jgi:hypothetical protein